MKILIIQTAFLGDVILTLPLAQALRHAYGDATIDMVVIPSAAEIVSRCPAVDRMIMFDKKGTQKGILQAFRFGRTLQKNRYDIVVTPHRSMRTGLLTSLSRAKIRIGFSNSALPWMFTQKIRWQEHMHEVDRNLQLLQGLGIAPPVKERPHIKPSDEDCAVVESLLAEAHISTGRLIAIAPGSVWYTKRWPAEKYAALISDLESEGSTCVLVGGKDDQELAARILNLATPSRSVSAVGKLTLVQSAELIRRSDFLVTNDSAPLHLGVAMETRIIAIFGPTIPAFGFAPYGAHDSVVEQTNLSCRPCTKHGGAVCPIGTFECMESISPSSVIAQIRSDN